MVDKVEADVVEGGLLVYCSSAAEASKVAGLKNKAGAPAIEFYKDGHYQSVIDADSIKQVKISYHGQDHYFKQVAVSSGDDADSFSASAWIETGADGKVIGGKTNLQLCYGGYTGSVPPSANDPKAKSALAIMSGQMNPQNKQVSGFVKKALDAASQEGEIAHIENYGHSTGASNAMLSNAIVNGEHPDKSEAILVEPFKADQCIQTMLVNQAQLNLPATISSADLVKNTYSRMAARRGSDGKLSRSMFASMFLGDGVGDQALVDMGPDEGGGLQQAIIDHKASNVAMAEDAGTATEKATPGAGNSIQGWIMGMLSTFLKEIFGNLQHILPPAITPPSTDITGITIPSLGTSGVSLTGSDVSTNLPGSVKPLTTNVTAPGLK